MDVVIDRVCEDNLFGFRELLNKYSFYAGLEYYDKCLERQAVGDLDVYAASFEGKGMIGHCILNWIPRYAMFRELGIPEIQDLNVLRDYRQRGIGRHIIKFCEDAASARGHDVMGISVGLDRSFGSAQRLYVHMGYVPDGNGVTYDRKPVTVGDFKPIDENLSLMMTKSLKN